MASTHWACCCGTVSDGECVPLDLSTRSIVACCVKDTSTAHLNLEWSVRRYVSGTLEAAGTFRANQSLPFDGFGYSGYLRVNLTGWQTSRASSCPSVVNFATYNEYLIFIRPRQATIPDGWNTRLLDDNTGELIRDFWTMFSTEFRIDYTPEANSVTQLPSTQTCNNGFPQRWRHADPFTMLNDKWYVVGGGRPGLVRPWYDILQVSCHRMKAKGGMEWPPGADDRTEIDFDFDIERSENDCCLRPSPGPGWVGLQCLEALNTGKPNGSGACCPITQFAGMELEIFNLDDCDIFNSAQRSHCYNFPGDGTDPDDISDGRWEMAAAHYWTDWQTSATGTSGHYLAQVAAPGGVIAQFTRRVSGLMQWVDFNDNASMLEPSGPNATYDGSCGASGRGLVRPGHIDMSITFLPDTVHILVTATVDPGFGSNGFDDLIYEAFIEYDPNTCTRPTNPALRQLADIDFMLRTVTTNRIANIGDSDCLKATVQNQALRIAYRGTALVYARL